MGVVENDPDRQSTWTSRMTVGEVPVKVMFSAYEGKLYAVTLETEHLGHSRELLRILRAAYGEGIQDNQHMEKFRWSGNRTGMSYDENEITGEAQVYIFSRVGFEYRDSKENERAQEAASDL